MKTSFRYSRVGMIIDSLWMIIVSPLAILLLGITAVYKEYTYFARNFIPNWKKRGWFKGNP